MASEATSFLFVIFNWKSAGSQGTKPIKRIYLGWCKNVSALSKFELDEHYPLREGECLGGCNVHLVILQLQVDMEHKPLIWWNMESRHHKRVNLPSSVLLRHFMKTLANPISTKTHSEKILFFRGLNFSDIGRKI